MGLHGQLWRQQTVFDECLSGLYHDHAQLHFRDFKYIVSLYINVQINNNTRN